MKSKKGGLMSCAFLSYTFFTSCDASLVLPWSHLYRKVYSVEEQRANSTSDAVVWSKKKVNPFTQLILSFNVFREENDVFNFSVRAHTQGAPENVWGEWYKMFSWGDTVQRSFFKRGEQSSCNHVRIEMKEGFLGDGFQVKVESVQPAALKAVKALFICASNYKEFKPERPYIAGKDLESVLITGVVEKSQKMIDHPRMGALCSPTTVSMMLEALTKEAVDPLETARGVYDQGLDVFGNWVFNMAYAFEKAEGRALFATVRLSSFEKLYQLLVQGIPVGVSIRGSIKGGRNPYVNGHLLLVIGFDAKAQQVICLDPAFDKIEQVRIAYDIAEFIPAWERSFRLAYQVFPNSKS